MLIATYFIIVDKKPTQTSINRRKDKQIVIQLQKGTLFSNLKKNELLAYKTMWMNLKNIMRSERSQMHTQNIPYYFIYIKF